MDVKPKTIIKPLGPMVGGAIEKTIVTIPSLDQWSVTIKTHQKTIEYQKMTIAMV